MPKTTTVQLRVAIADDHTIFRRGLAVLLNDISQLTLVGEAENGEQLISLVGNKKPDIVLTDIQMPVMDGIKATTFITSTFPQVAVIGLTMFDNEETLLKMIRAGARGYLLKNADATELLSAIQTVKRNGSYYFTSSVSTHLKQMKEKENAEATANPVLFTQKELDVIKLICRQYSNKEIADEIGCTIRSVESARERIQAKTGTKNMVGIALYAVKNNIARITEV